MKEDKSLTYKSARYERLGEIIEIIDSMVYDDLEDVLNYLKNKYNLN